MADADTDPVWRKFGQLPRGRVRHSHSPDHGPHATGHDFSGPTIGIKWDQVAEIGIDRRGGTNAFGRQVDMA